MAIIALSIIETISILSMELVLVIPFFNTSKQGDSDAALQDPTHGLPVLITVYMIAHLFQSWLCCDAVRVLSFLDWTQIIDLQKKHSSAHGICVFFNLYIITGSHSNCAHASL